MNTFHNEAEKRITSTLDLGNDKVLEIKTYKSLRGHLVTNASVSKREGNFLTHAMYLDYSKQFAFQNVRCTKKVMLEQHGEVLTQLETIKKEVEEHYKLQTV